MGNMAKTRIPTPLARCRTVTLAALLLVPVGMVSACSSGPPALTVEELRAKLADTEKRAVAAEKRAKAAEDAASSQAVKGMEPTTVTPDTSGVGPPEVAQNDAASFGQPVLDTAPIDPAPVNPPSQ